MSAILINKTPHPVTVFSDVEGTVTYGAAESPARVSEERSLVGYNNDCIPFYIYKYGQVTGLPPEEDPDVAYIVSSQVMQAIPQRNDLLVPADMVRDDQGRIIGCNGFRISQSTADSNPRWVHLVSAEYRTLSTQLDSAQ